MSQTTPVQAAADSVAAPPTREAPDQVLREKLDSALMAELEVVDAPRAAAPPEPGLSPVLPVALAVLVVALVATRLLSARVARWWARHKAPGRGKAAAPVEVGDPVSGAGGPPPPRPRPAPKAPKPIQLPPHVAAMLARVDERRAAEATGAPSRPPAPGVDADGNADDGPGGGGGGLDVWIGR